MPHPRFVVFVLCLGTLLRVIWAGDMEWKGDEKWNYDQGQAIARTGRWPAVGMESSVGVFNPGLSVWVFGALSYAAHSPIGVVRWVQALNIAALWGFLLFILLAVPKERRAPWLWGLMLAAVSPLAVLFRENFGRRVLCRRSVSWRVSATGFAGVFPGRSSGGLPLCSWPSFI